MLEHRGDLCMRWENLVVFFTLHIVMETCFGIVMNACTKRSTRSVVSFRLSDDLIDYKITKDSQHE